MKQAPPAMCWKSLLPSFPFFFLFDGERLRRERKKKKIPFPPNRKKFVSLSCDLSLWGVGEGAGAAHVWFVLVEDGRKPGTFTFLVSYQVGLSRFHRCWQKARDSWVRDWGYHYSKYSNKCESHILTSSPSLQGPWGDSEQSRWTLCTWWVCVTADRL